MHGHGAPPQHRVRAGKLIRDVAARGLRTALCLGAALCALLAWQGTATAGGWAVPVQQASVTPSPSTTFTPTHTATGPTPTGTLTPTITPTGPTATASLTPTITLTPTPLPTATSTGTITPTPTQTPTVTLTPLPSETPTITPLPTFVPTRGLTATFFPTASPRPTSTPTQGPLLESTRQPEAPGGELARLVERQGLTLRQAILFAVVLFVGVGGSVFAGLAYWLSRQPKGE